MAGVTWDKLPAGVEWLKRYRSLGVLVECTHALEHQHPTGGWMAYREGSPEIRWEGEMSERLVRTLMPDGFTLDYGGILRCSVCQGDEQTTDCFRRPVKLLVEVPDPEPQSALF